MADYEYTGIRDQFMEAADNLHAPFFYYSPANVVPKLALGKLELRPFRHTWVLASPDGSVRVVPIGTREEYHAALMEAAWAFPRVLLIPAPNAQVLRNAIATKVQHKEYLFPTETIVNHPGKRLKRTRTSIHAAGRQCTSEVFDPRRVLADYLALNARWYREAAPTKFRTYDKVSIDWLLSNWRSMKVAFPDLVCIGIRDSETRELQSFNVGSMLTKSIWTAYTERYLRTGINAANTLGFTLLGQHFDSYATENDGTADTKEIRQIKDRLGLPAVVAYEVTK